MWSKQHVDGSSNKSLVMLPLNPPPPPLPTPLLPQLQGRIGSRTSGPPQSSASPSASASVGWADRHSVVDVGSEGRSGEVGDT
jgi:hypothetical protein